MEIINNLDGDLQPIADLVGTLLSQEVETLSVDGNLQLVRRLGLGSEAYAVTLFKGVEDSTIDRYEKIHSIEIPKTYRDVLHVLNGASVFGLNLYGIPSSMAKDPPLLDRSAVQPLDIATANARWRFGFSSDESLFQIGGAPWTPEENVAYFLTGDSGVASIRKHNVENTSWVGLRTFLSDEIDRVQDVYQEIETLLAGTRRKFGPSE